MTKNDFKPKHKTYDDLGSVYVLETLKPTNCGICNHPLPTYKDIDRYVCCENCKCLHVLKEPQEAFNAED